MARSLANKVNVDPPSPEFPFGRIRDKIEGTQEGTPVDEAVYGDFHQFFAKIMSLAGLAYNEVEESEYDGFQYVDALIQVIKDTKTRWDDLFFSATGHNVNNNIDEIIYTQSAPADFAANSLSIKAMMNIGISGGGNAGTFGVKLKINGVLHANFSGQYPIAFSGITILATFFLVCPVSVTKGDTITLEYATSSASNPYATVSNINVQASSHDASNF